MTWSDLTYKTDDPAEVTEMPDGRIELSWASRDGSRLTVELDRAESAALAETVLVLLASWVAV